ncbi:MAG: hypothetical protein PVH91_16775 [Pseudomonadales bacterium]|jgi:hypothetical protein
MRKVLAGVAVLVGILMVATAAHFALIEIGREVVTVRTFDASGTPRETRLWVVDEDGAAWLHSTGPGWAARFVGDPVVELGRGGRVQRYRAHAVPGPHPVIDALLREKYGIADRWVRLIAPDTSETLVVRLDPIRD